MKIFIVSLFLLSMLIAGVFYTQHKMADEIKKQEVMVSELYNTISSGNWEKSAILAGELEKEIKSKTFFYGLFVEHIDYDNLLTNTAQGMEFVYNKAKSDSLSQCKILLTLLEHMKDKSAITWENLL